MCLSGGRFFLRSWRLVTFDYIMIVVFLKFGKGFLRVAGFVVFRE